MYEGKRRLGHVVRNVLQDLHCRSESPTPPSPPYNLGVMAVQVGGEGEGGED